MRKRQDEVSHRVQAMACGADALARSCKSAEAKRRCFSRTLDAMQALGKQHSAVEELAIQLCRQFSAMQRKWRVCHYSLTAACRVTANMPQPLLAR
jgi:hypothetical protein